MRVGGDEPATLHRRVPAIPKEAKPMAAQVRGLHEGEGGRLAGWVNAQKSTRMHPDRPENGVCPHFPADASTKTIEEDVAAKRHVGRRGGKRSRNCPAGKKLRRVESQERWSRQWTQAAQTRLAGTGTPGSKGCTGECPAAGGVRAQDDV